MPLTSAAAAAAALAGTSDAEEQKQQDTMSDEITSLQDAEKRKYFEAATQAASKRLEEQAQAVRSLVLNVFDLKKRKSTQLAVINEVLSKNPVFNARFKPTITSVLEKDPSLETYQPDFLIVLLSEIFQSDQKKVTGLSKDFENKFNELRKDSKRIRSLVLTIFDLKKRTNAQLAVINEVLLKNEILYAKFKPTITAILEKDPSLKTYPPAFLDDLLSEIFQLDVEKTTGLLREFGKEFDALRRDYRENSYQLTEALTVLRNNYVGQSDRLTETTEQKKTAEVDRKRLAAECERLNRTNTDLNQTILNLTQRQANGGYASANTSAQSVQGVDESMQGAAAAASSSRRQTRSSAASLENCFGSHVTHAILQLLSFAEQKQNEGDIPSVIELLGKLKSVTALDEVIAVLSVSNAEPNLSQKCAAIMKSFPPEQPAYVPVGVGKYGVNTSQWQLIYQRFVGNPALEIKEKSSLGRAIMSAYNQSKPNTSASLASRSSVRATPRQRSAVPLFVETSAAKISPGKKRKFTHEQSLRPNGDSHGGDKFGKAEDGAPKLTNSPQRGPQ